MRCWLRIRQAAVLASLLAAATASHAATPEVATGDCAPSNGLEYVCGPAGSEDLARIPGTRWLVTSGLNVGAPAHLYLIDTRSRRTAILFPTDATASRATAPAGSRCPGPPDLAALSTDGLNLRPGRGRRHRLYVANHGDRNAIEVLQIDARGSVPTATWIDCLPLPAGTLANAVVPLADGSVLVSSFYDPRDSQAWERMARGEGTGSIWQGRSGQPFQRVATGEISGANGLEVSADERTLYVSAWSGRALLVIDRRTGARRAIALNFLPDNIKRRADGSLLLAGQRSEVARIAGCSGASCPQDWIVVRVDPVAGTVTNLVSRPGDRLINYACGALEVGDRLFITARGDRRLAVVPVKSLPSLQ